MSFFDWLQHRKRDVSLPAVTNASSGPMGMRDRGGNSDQAKKQTSSPGTYAEPAMNHIETRKAKRHARREELYVAVREAMTRSGVLASSYKFKVLSLDQNGEEFLVMVDTAETLNLDPEKCKQIENAIMQTARARFEITVTSVYWRTDEKTALDIATTAGSKTPILPGAFHAAGAAASAVNQHADTAVTSGKTRSGLHSYTLLTGYEDTEMPKSYAAPALSTTQYGDRK